MFAKVFVGLVAAAGLAAAGVSFGTKTTQANGSCCYPGAACCEAGLPCCDTGVCCGLGACCAPGAECCETGECCGTAACCGDAGCCLKPSASVTKVKASCCSATGECSAK